MAVTPVNAARGATSAAIDRVSTVLRERIPPLTAWPLPGRVDDRLLHQRWPARELAEPPAGSGLAPVLGDAGPPLVGNALTQMRFGVSFGLRRFERYGPVSWTGAFGQRIVTLTGADATQAALVNRDKAFSQEGWRFFIDKFFHRGLMLLDFDEHRMHRRIMQEAFTRHRLAGYVASMGPALRQGVGAWPSSPRLYWALKQLTLDVATRVFMDMRSDDEAREINRAFVACVRAGTALLRYPVPGGRWRAGLEGRKRLERYFTENLPAKRASDGDDLFSALCHATTPDGERFTDLDVVNHMVFLMMAAHDTTTITSTAAAYYLAKNPEWQERVRDESLALGDDHPDMAALDSLTSLELVIKEALRLVAPVPSLSRATVKDTEVLGHYIPEGTLVGVAPSVNHFDPACWTDPHRFDPERFAADRREDKSHRFAWMPFGGGAHKCIGLHFGMYETKALLHELVRSYRITVPDDYEVRWDYVSLPVPVDGLPVHLQPV
ncbi:cytochrome P450 [Prauserella isguenensis]|uniref:Cytochrome P450 n=1 Tax=Prauserella isguenensis TaxID=1470180 RepID=A0A839S150_9PSEU|nr:cytochrome P450 [Prauserella isguenensis]MBB3050780.1 cytochrome P450 [Prauserella isguenensis]